MEQGKAAGLSGDAVTELESRLSGSVKVEQSEIDNLVNLYSAGKLSEALSMGTALINRQPDNYIVHNILGAINIDFKNHYDAKRSCKKAVLLCPYISEFYNDLGHSLNNLLSFEQALTVLNWGSKIDSHSAIIFINSALSSRGLGDAKTALVLLNKAEAISPHIPELYNNRGLIMGEQHHDPKIIVEYSKAVILNPTFLEGYNNLGRTLARVGQMSQADRIYHRALKIDPNSAVVLNNFGLLKKIDDDIEQAILLFEKAIAIDSKYKKARINLANSLMMAKRFEPALIHYDLLNITQSRAQVLEVLYILEI